MTYHIEIEKNDGEEDQEGLYLLGEVAESGSPFRRWVDVGAGFLKKFICETILSRLQSCTLSCRNYINEVFNLLPTVRVLMCFGLSL